MTLQEAITALLDEYHLEDMADMVRDEVRGDPGFSGLSQNHPRVQRFHEVYRTLRDARTDPAVTA